MTRKAVCAAGAGAEMPGASRSGHDASGGPQWAYSAAVSSTVSSGTVTTTVMPRRVVASGVKVT